MKLFYTPGASSLFPHIVLCELGLPHELEKVDLRSHATADGSDYYAINPKGYVPALQLDDGQLLTEGPAIAQYLADREPEAGLLPAAGTLERARVEELLTFIGTEIDQGYNPHFHPDTSVGLGTYKTQPVRESGAEGLVYGDNSCLMHIGGLLERQQSGVRVMHLAEILASTDGGAS